MQLTPCAATHGRRTASRLVLPFYLIGLLVAWLMFETAFADSVDGLSVGIFPRRDSQTTREMFEPLMEYLSQELDLEVSLDVPPDFEAFWVRLRENRYDLVHLNQYQYLRAHQLYGYEAILRNEEMGRSEIATVIWVRQGEGIDRPRDLKGKKVIFGGGRQAMVSYIMAVDLLREHGLEDDEYLMEFALNPVSAVLSLYYRQSVAAGSGDILPQLLAIREPIPVDAFKPLLKSRPVAQLPWAVSPTLTEKHSGQIMHALTQLKQTIGGQQLLVGAGLTGIVLATDSDYDPHRRIVARVLMEQY